MFKYKKFLQDVQDCQRPQFRPLDWMSQRFKKSNSKSWSHDRFWSWNEVRFLSRSISGWTNTIWSKLAPPPPPQVTGWKLAEIIILDFVRSRWKIVDLSENVSSQLCLRLRLRLPKSIFKDLNCAQREKEQSRKKNPKIYGLWAATLLSHVSSVRSNLQLKIQLDNNGFCKTTKFEHFMSLLIIINCNLKGTLQTDNCYSMSLIWTTLPFLVTKFRSAALNPSDLFTTLLKFVHCSKFGFTHLRELIDDNEQSLLFGIGRELLDAEFFGEALL